jgi:ornithine cyclodeaminase/alanine dehydrogenase-like protein (mu-crystallin family)
MEAESLREQENAAAVLMIDNHDAADLLGMADAIKALRLGYHDLVDGRATYVPRIDVFAPTASEDHFYQWGSMAGLSTSYRVLAVRMKSDIVSWPHGERQEKYALRPGLYCGLILLFDIVNGVPLAVIQDGYIQHLRVGAAAGIGTDALARPNASKLAVLGSGGMADVHLDAIASVRDLTSVSVFSPDPQRRRDFAQRAEKRIGVPVHAVHTAEAAVRGSDIVVTATSSMVATFEAGWLDEGCHVTCVTRRELSEELLARADAVVQLGIESMPTGLPIPMMEWKAGGMAAYVCGDATERARIPTSSHTQTGRYPTLLDLEQGTAAGRETPGDITLFVNVGTQGLQFAAVAGHLYRLAVAANVGRKLPLEWFIEDLRD